jgi:hypothetical protein
VRHLLRLLHCWWAGDRIRASPRQGQLLCLGPGSILLLAGEPAQVLERHTQGACVCYRCVTAAGECEIVVQPNDAIVVRRGSGERLLGSEHVDAIAGPACSKPFNS